MLNPSPGRLKVSGKYRVEQPMENFKIRLKIVQKRTELAELFEEIEDYLDDNFLQHEEYDFDWQEKVFGPYEAKFYREERNCRTDKQKEYHRMLSEDEGNQGSRLYSYVQGDSYYPDTEVVTGTYRSELSARNERAAPSLKNRKPFSDRYNKKVVDEKPSDQRICENHYLYKERECMYIVADLSPLAAPSDTVGAETLLCTISYDPLQKLLTVNPDFTTDECYSVWGPGMAYDFYIEHVSQQPTARELQRLKDFHAKQIQRKLDMKKAQLAHKLLVPAPKVLRVLLSLEICYASDFNTKNGLFVSFFVDLPERWSVFNGERRGMAGRTQRCHPRDNRANFGFCSEVLLDLDLAASPNDRGDSTEEVAVVKWPILLISVGSMDNWTRYRIEGYGSLSIPNSPGVHEITLKTWRPADNFVDMLRRFFTGGTRELEDITYCGIPSMHEGSTLDKTCLETVNSGNVHLKLSIVHQSQDLAKRRAADPRKLNAGTLLNNVDDVLTQFKAARERMIQARAMCS